MVLSRESTEEAMEVEMVKRGGDVLTAPTAEEGKVTVVHSDVVGQWGKCEREE
jgi:hypothetical protein